jgi:multicomponent Na+:H+ antiporter subunit D
VSLLAAPFAILWVAVVVVATVRSPGLRRWLAIAVLAAVTAIVGALLWQTRDGRVIDLVAGGWPDDVGIVIRADALGAGFAFVSLLVVLAALMHATLTREGPRGLPILMLLLGLGLTGLFLTGDVFNFYVFFELSMVAAYGIAGQGGGRRRTGGAFIFAVVNLIGSFLFLIAVAALYRVTGTLEMEAIAETMAEVDPNTAILIAITFFLAFAVKLGLFPFHYWLPAIYVVATPAVAAVLSGALANIGAYGILRFGAGLLPREAELGGSALIVLGLASIIYGSIQALSRRDTREVLAYSSIGQAGYVLIGLGVGGPLGLAAAVIFSLANALTKAVLFLGVGLRGPVVAAAFGVGALSVTGVPPSAGFFGKAALIETGVEGGALLVALIVLGSALSFIYMFQAYQHDFWRVEQAGPPAAAGTAAVVGFMGLVVLGLGVWPEPLLAVGEQAGNVLGVPR